MNVNLAHMQHHSRTCSVQLSCRFGHSAYNSYWLIELTSLSGSSYVLNTLRPRQDGRHFADDDFKRIFLNENVWIFIDISLKFIPKGPIDNIPALVQIMAWRRSGDKPLSEPMVVRLPTHICVTRPQWVNSSLQGQNGRHFADDSFRCIFVSWMKVLYFD